MAKYLYQARDKDGNLETGTMTAADEDELYRCLKEKGKFLIDTEDALDDETLIAAMKNAFEDECRGEVELLAAKFLPEFVRQLRLRGAADWTEGCYDDE